MICSILSVGCRDRLDVSVLDIRTTKGQRLEGTGVLPDRAVPVTLNDLRSDRDAALVAAIEILKAAAKTAPAAGPGTGHRSFSPGDTPRRGE